MKLYRFSPIRSQVELLQALEYVHETCNRLCFETVGTYLPVRGNIGIFCHDYAEFTYLTGLREKLTNRSPNYNEKYFPLKQPITFSETDGIPAATYEYLYIRQVDPYRSQVGDVDFVMSPDPFEVYKAKLITGEFRDGARLFERPEENLIELWLPSYDAVSFVANNDMSELISGKNADIAGVIVRNDEGKYLFIQEKRPDVYGKWNLPAGRRVSGETTAEAAVREAREDTGYQVELLQNAPVFEKHLEAAGRTFCMYAAKITGESKLIDPDEVLDVQWMSFDEVKALHMQGKLRAEVMLEALAVAEQRFGK